MAYEIKNLVADGVLKYRHLEFVGTLLKAELYIMFVFINCQSLSITLLARV